jgi:hypothetical protein
MGLFGKNPEKLAQEEAAKAEADRLVALPVHDLAAEMMGAWGPDGPGKGESGKSLNILQVASWLMSSYPRGAQYCRPLLDPIREGFQALEHAELVQQRAQSAGGGRMYATRLGLKALAEGNVRDYLKQSTPA